MAGVANDYLIYPILDLIRDEIRKTNLTNNTSAGSDPFAGTPSVSMYRESKTDPDRVTGALIQYVSGYQVEMFLTFGTNSWNTLPPEVRDENHPDFDYLWNQRLTRVTVVSLMPNGLPLLTVNIGLNYNDSGLLTGTSVNRI